MKRVLRVRGQGKVAALDWETVAGEPAVRDLEARVALIQALLPLGLRAVAEALQAEVTALTGPRDRRAGRRPGPGRWSTEAGSVSLRDQKLPIRVPRVRDRLHNQQIPLAPDQALQERRLEGYDCGVRVPDGKTCAADQLVIALGITLAGEQGFLGFVQTAPENERGCAACLGELGARGLRAAQGRLCGLDGAQGWRKAVAGVFGAPARVPRCQGHQREHGLDDLPTAQRPASRPGDQKHRWLAAALRDIEPRLRRLQGSRALPRLPAALQRELAAKAQAA